MTNVCNKDCTKCNYLNIKTDSKGYPWGYDCMKYENSVLEKDFSNTKFFPVFEITGGESSGRTVDR